MEFNSSTAVALIRLIASLAAGVASTFGWAFDAELWLNILLSFIAVVLFGYSWWKNNNITAAAQEAQIVLNQIKVNEKEYEYIPDPEEIYDFEEDVD